MIVERLLGENRFQECFKISKLKNRVGGTKPVTDEVFLESYRKYFEDNDDFYAIGCIEDDRVISWISIAFIDNETRGRLWVIPSLFTTKFTEYFSFNNDEIGFLIKEAFRLAESKKYYEYYYIVSERIATVYEKQIQKNKHIPVGRYDYFEITRIPANTQPDNSFHWRLMGGELRPDTMIIKKRILREKYR